MGIGQSGIMKVTILFVLIPVMIVCENDIVTTKLGQIKGLILQNGIDKVYQFRNIPYAKPPIGSLRFSKPEPYGTWNNVKDGTKFPPLCMQVESFLINISLTGMNENCLFLNIYVPNELSNTNRKSVMVWIHGGGLVEGTGSTYDGSELALSGDVIVVTINYRLGIFGFISSGSSVLPGNYGLWDQRLAIAWVKDNIAAFGGNSSSITIFGESAGGWSVGFQSISPLNVGLFQRAILQSGSASSKLASRKTGNLKLFASHSGCVNQTTKETITDIVKCMQQKSSSDLLQAYATAISKIDSFVPILGATVDGELIPDEPIKLLRNMSSPSSIFFRSLDVTVGTVSGEGSLFLLYAYFFKVNMINGMTSKFLCDVVSPIIARDFFNTISMVSTAICDKYKVPDGDTTMMKEQGRQLVDMYGDLFYVSPAVDVLNFHSKNNSMANTFQYLFNRDLFHLLPTPEWFQGAQHASELVFLFSFADYAKQNTVSVKQEDQILSQSMLKYWTNFAKSGNPNAGSSLQQWPHYTVTNGDYLHLDLNIQTKTHLFDDRVKFWLKDIPRILNPEVQTKSGTIKGVAIQYHQGAIAQFRGIPYAQPPMGNLRFEKPQPVNKWTHVLDALTYPPSCIQEIPSILAFLPNKEFSEDCLYLNIYVPGNVSSSNKKAVMIWIHGGGYITGQASIYDGSFLSLRGDVIVVTVNYRLGVFGFISSSDSILPGNYGLWDQKLAIEWVKTHIAAFGGDPFSITLFGESAGGFSVALLALSPLNKSLFQRMIAQSGTSLAPMAISKSTPNLAVLYGNALNCTNTSTSVIVDCLRSKSSDELHSSSRFVGMQFYQLKSYPQGYPYDMLKPTVDGDLIPDEPRKLLGDSSSKSYKFFKSLDLMVGTTSIEGSSLLPLLELLKVNVTLGIPTSVLCNNVSIAMAFGIGNNMAVTSQKICNKYKEKHGDSSNLIEQGKQILNVYGDALVVSPAVELLNLHSIKNYQSKTFQYLFSRQLPTPLEVIPFPAWFEGASHGSEIFYVFGIYQYYARLFNLPVPPEDMKLVDAVMSYWTNFAKKGDPNKYTRNLPTWPQFTNREKKYVDFGSDTSIKEKKMLWSERLKFWFDLRGLSFIVEDSTTTGEATIKQPSLSLILISFLLVILQ